MLELAKATFSRSVRCQMTSPTLPFHSTPIAASPLAMESSPTSVATSQPPAAISLRTLHLVNGEHFSGAERVQSHLGRCLPQSGIQVDFACTKPGRFADAIDEANGDWGTAYRTAMKSRLDFSVVSRITKLVRHHQYELLHAHTPRSAMVASLVSRVVGVPWVYHVHSPAARDSAKRFGNWINATTERLSLRGCSHLITVSDSLRRELLANGHPPDRVTVVRNGVPGIRYERRSTPEVGSRWMFGMVALMRPRKGLEVALDAIASLREQGLDARLRCIGPFETDDYQRKIQSQIKSLGINAYVEQTGFKSNVPATLAQLDAMLLPSLYGEGLPMVVLEAMASALPVIATKVEGTPEAIRNGIDGLLAEPNSAASLAEKMSELMLGKVSWSELSESAFKRHADCFSDHAMASGVASVYGRVCPSRYPNGLK